MAFVYDSTAAEPHVNSILNLIEPREEVVDLLDIGMADNQDDARREAMLTVKSAVRIGTPPDALFDDTGRPDFSAGAMVVEERTGRRSLHVGPEALEVLREED